MVLILNKSEEKIMRSESFIVKMDKEFKNKLFDRAHEYGLSASEYVRFLVVNEIKNNDK